jgi:hypothetical protein
MPDFYSQLVGCEPFTLYQKPLQAAGNSTQTIKTLSMTQTSSSSLRQSCVGSRSARGKLYLHDFATHFHDALLLTEPVIVGNQFRKIGIL